MPIYESHSRVGANGVLNLALSLGSQAANLEVKVTIESIESPSPATTAEWRRRVLELAGSINDPTFVRHEQGELEDRGEMFP